MRSKRFACGVIALILASLACNLGAPAETPTPAATIDATIQADQILATGFAELTASAQSSTPTDSPTETSTPLATLPPVFTATSTNTSIPTATNTSPPSIPGWPLVRQGDNGPVVAALQHLLKFKGQDVNVDGAFGPQTRNAVMNFQTANGLGVDGIVGPQTWSALIQGAQMQEGSTSQAVRAAQYLLRNKYGYGIGVDGIFGPQTENAVRDFQSSHGLTVDGIVGPQTWQTLIAS